ncbi:MAG: hypothetical protein VKN15_02130 [Cyanobacteriota bacterium]|nr:hypothetical protein [Cyanobacteriota bacterium]
MVCRRCSDTRTGHPRCTASEIKAALERLLDGELFRADRSWKQIWWGLMHLQLRSGWRIAIWIERDALGTVDAATSPDGRDWIHGCQRDDWTLGPESKIVEPVALLQPEQRIQLARLLRNARCRPAPEPAPGSWGLTLGQLECIRRPRRPRQRNVSQAAPPMPPPPT